MLCYALFVISETLHMYEILTEPLHVHSFIQHLKFFVFMHGGNDLQIKGCYITYFKESRLILHVLYRGCIEVDII